MEELQTHASFLQNLTRTRANAEVGRKEKDMTGSNTNGKPHAICLPLPLQSHITAMLNLAKLLHHTANFHVTFINTDFNHRRILKSRGSNAVNGLPGFRFESFSDGLPSSDINASQDIPSLAKACKNNFLGPFLDLVAMKLVGVPPVTCIVADILMSTLACAAGEELGVPAVSLCPVAACALMGAYQYGHLVEKGYVPLKDSSYLTNGYLDTIIDWIPGMNHMRLRDLPSYLQVTDPDDFMFNFVKEEVEMASQKASAMIINTFDELERDVLKALAPVIPHLFPIGPINLLLNQIPPHSPISSIGSNLWSEESDCLRWLDSKAPDSVIYVNFGSVAVATPEQLTEFAWGLAGTNRDFLWVIRPDLVVGGVDSTVWPPEFEEQTRGRAFISGWCPQERVLNHASVGLFLTHCGWNSMLESLCCGVPMICRPFFADQPTNCRYSCLEWGVGVEIAKDVKRGDVKRLVMEVMEEEKGRRMKERVMGWKELAAGAAAPGGAAVMNLGEAVKLLVLK